MLLDGKWDRGRERKKKRKKKSDRRKGEKLIATFCSAINGDEEPEGKETFRWLREDVSRCPLFPSSHLIHPFPRQSAPLIPNFSVKLPVTLNNNNNGGNDEDEDDRPANGIKGEKYSRHSKSA